jgi:HSP20 family protein
MNLIRREPRLLQSNPGTALEPFGVLRSLLRWDPFRDLDYSLEAQGAFTPSFDIQETPEAYVFEADLPGIAQEDLDLNLAGNRLTVTGRRESATRKEGRSYFMNERSFGTFSRSFNLPDGVDGSRVKADLKQGVLTLTLPKAPEVQTRKIAVTASAQ